MIHCLKSFHQRNGLRFGRVNLDTWQYDTRVSHVPIVSPLHLAVAQDGCSFWWRRCQNLCWHYAKELARAFGVPDEATEIRSVVERNLPVSDVVFPEERGREPQPDDAIPLCMAGASGLAHKVAAAATVAGRWVPNSAGGRVGARHRQLCPTPLGPRQLHR